MKYRKVQAATKIQEFTGFTGLLGSLRLTINAPITYQPDRRPASTRVFDPRQREFTPNRCTGGRRTKGRNVHWPRCPCKSWRRKTVQSERLADRHRTDALRLLSCVTAMDADDITKANSQK